MAWRFDTGRTGRSCGRPSKARWRLERTDRVAEDPVAELGLHGVAHDQVDGAAEDLLQAALHPEEVEQADRAVELHEKIHVARGCGFTARHGSEDLERTNAQLCKVAALLGEPALDLFTCHEKIL